jgi:hypothetical protein
MATADPLSSSRRRSSGSPLAWNSADWMAPIVACTSVRAAVTVAAFGTVTTLPMVRSYRIEKFVTSTN